MASDRNTSHVSISSDVTVTLIGAETRFKGNINTHTPVYIDGYFEGTIESDNAVVVSETGKLKADIHCREMLLKGNAEGKILCEELMEFSETGVLTGELHTANLKMGPGAVMNGSMAMDVNK